MAGPKILQKAVSQSPQDAATHWQLGQVWIDGKWLTPDQAQKFAAGDKRLAEYRKLRNRSVLTVDSQAALARWCRKNKLADEERVHWQIVLQLQPGNAEAIQGLGLKPYAGMLLTQSQIQQVKIQVQKLGKAVDRWRPLVVQWRNAVDASPDGPAGGSAGQARQDLRPDRDGRPGADALAGGRRQAAQGGVSRHAPGYRGNAGRQSASRRRPSPWPGWRSSRRPRTFGQRRSRA